MYASSPVQHHKPSTRAIIWLPRGEQVTDWYFRFRTTSVMIAQTNIDLQICKHLPYLVSCIKRLVRNTFYWVQVIHAPTIHSSPNGCHNTTVLLRVAWHSIPSEWRVKHMCTLTYGIPEEYKSNLEQLCSLISGLIRTYDQLSLIFNNHNGMRLLVYFLYETSYVSAMEEARCSF